MDWKGLIINLVSLFIGFFLYIGIYHTKLADKLDKYKYPVLLAVLLLVCLIGGALRLLF